MRSKNLIGWLLFAGFVAGCIALMRSAVYESERLTEQRRSAESREQERREIDQMVRDAAPLLECDDGIVKFAGLSL